MDKKIGGFFNKLKDTVQSTIQNTVQDINSKKISSEGVSTDNQVSNTKKSEIKEKSTMEIINSENKIVSFTNNENKEKEEKKNQIEKNEYAGFASGFPEWTLEPPSLTVRRKRQWIIFLKLMQYG